MCLFYLFNNNFTTRYSGVFINNLTLRNQFGYTMKHIFQYNNIDINIIISTYQLKNSGYLTRNALFLLRYQQSTHSKSY